MNDKIIVLSCVILLVLFCGCKVTKDTSEEQGFELSSVPLDEFVVMKTSGTHYGRPIDSKKLRVDGCTFAYADHVYIGEVKGVYFVDSCSAASPAVSSHDVIDISVTSTLKGVVSVQQLEERRTDIEVA